MDTGRDRKEVTERNKEYGGLPVENSRPCRKRRTVLRQAEPRSSKPSSLSVLVCTILGSGPYAGQHWCHRSLVTLTSSRLVNFLDESAFFAVSYEEWETLFDPDRAPAVPRATNGSYGVHFWNKLSKNRGVVTGSGSAMDVLARTHCPNVYEQASLEGFF
ncbi:hypothetical protein MTO96_005484 [Rhipicephalus appendiculatus]